MRQETVGSAAISIEEADRPFEIYRDCLRIATLLLLTALWLCSTASEAAGTARPAGTTLYVAKSVITLNPRQPRAEAVLVVGDRIARVGGRAELEALVAHRQHSVDDSLQHKVLVPGFIEQHLHPLLASLTMMADAVISIEDWDTPHGFAPRAASTAEFRAFLAEAVDDFDAAAGRPMLVWGYHKLYHGVLDRSLLDELAPDFPLMVWQRSCHEMIFNTAALEQFGINGEWISSWSNPAARVQADLEHGHFLEMAFWEEIFPRITPAIGTPERLLHGLEYLRTYFLDSGITTLVEPAGPLSRPLQSLVARAFGAQETPFSFYFIPDGRALALAHLQDGPDKLLAETEAMLGWSEGRTQFLPKQIKLLADGAIFSQLMVMRDGYTDGHHGEWIMQPDFFARVFDIYWDAGYQIHVHFNGDGGLDLVLDTLDAAMLRRPRFDHRTVAVHYGFAQPDQIRRIARLGAQVSANAVYTPTLADLYAEVGIGRERVERMVPLGETARAGIRISLHSDMPMAPADPLLWMWAAVNRTTPSGWVPGPDQRLSAEQALRAVTLDAAFSVRLEDQIGSIEPGKLANFTVLDDDPLTVDPVTLKDIGVWGTVFEGRAQPAAGAERTASQKPGR